MRFLICCLLVLGGASLFCQTDTTPETAKRALTEWGGKWTTAGPRYQGLELTTPIRMGDDDPATAAGKFLAAYGAAFGAVPADLTLLRQPVAANGVTYLHYQQHRRGFPVLGAEITVGVTAGGGVTGVKSSLRPAAGFVPASPTSPAPATAPFPDVLAAAALTDLAPHAAQWSIHPVAQVWTSANPHAPELTAELSRVYDVLEPGGHRSYRVYLNATSGKPVFRHQLHCDLSRQLYHGEAEPANLVWTEGNTYPGNLDAEDQEMMTATSEIYNLYNRTFGRRSFDGEDSDMTLISRRTERCPNASASGSSIWHCPGTVTDDIVSHEWAHNYTRSMNGLIYAYQSGAINEGLSDVFGETVDLLNARGGGNQTSARTQCNDGRIRWKMGEDATAFSDALRDMWNPECKGDPASKSSELYWCTEGDSGGVHINSGLVNKTYSLLVDGGTLNGVTVTGIGMTKALHVFYHASNVYMTSVTDFFALGDMLITSATDLAGTNLAALTLVDAPAMASGEIITAADVQQVRNAVAAAQLQAAVPCAAQPTLAQNPPDNCANAASPEEQILLSQDWEDGPGGWTTSQVAVNPGTWEDKPWVMTEQLADGRPGKGMFATNPRVGDCRTDLDNGLVHLTSPVVTIPVRGADSRLRFNHYYSIERNYDGGLLYVSRNGGGFTQVANEAFLYNGYDVFLVGPNGNDNPAAGQAAFSGSDENSTAGTWGTSVVDLAAAGVIPGDDIRLRWTMAHDGCNGWLGWYLDEVTVSVCSDFILPVTYRDLEADVQKNYVGLRWRTEQEAQNAGFHVERRAEGTEEFIALGFVAASGEADGDYRFTDRRVSTGVSYVYRLRQTDLDGMVHYSPLVSATLEARTDHLLAYPNPTQALLTVRADAGQREARLYDGAGRLVRTVRLTHGVAELATADLTAGVYLLRVGAQVQRVVKR